MNKILLLIFALCICTTQVYAINWVEVTAKNGKSASVDTDSITEYKNYFFYNIKVYNTYTSKDVVITMQSRTKGALSSRINYYKPDEYEKLNGDYINITKNMTRSLEPVEFGSVAYACYSKVKSLVVSSNTLIQF